MLYMVLIPIVNMYCLTFNIHSLSKTLHKSDRRDSLVQVLEMTGASDSGVWLGGFEEQGENRHWRWNIGQWGSSPLNPTGDMAIY